MTNGSGGVVVILPAGFTWKKSHKLLCVEKPLLPLWQIEVLNSIFRRCFLILSLSHFDVVRDHLPIALQLIAMFPGRVPLSLPSSRSSLAQDLESVIRAWENLDSWLMLKMLSCWRFQQSWWEVPCCVEEVAQHYQITLMFTPRWERIDTLLVSPPLDRCLVPEDWVSSARWNPTNQYRKGPRGPHQPKLFPQM